MRKLNLNILMSDKVPEKKQRQVQIGDELKSFVLFKKGLPKEMCLCDFHVNKALTVWVNDAANAPKFSAVHRQDLCFLCNIAPYLIHEQYQTMEELDQNGRATDAREEKN